MSAESAFEHHFDALPVDAFDQCDARSRNLLERCTNEAEHEGPHSFEIEASPLKLSDDGGKR